jgi:formate hydrogenlyase subunit 3/multisubunit Na+/H+ antiporter MnhD subunit
MLNWDFGYMRLLLAVLLFIVSVAGMYVFLYYQPQLDQSLGMPFILLGIGAITAFSWAGLFQRSITTYVIFSTIIQAAYFILDVGSVLVGGKSVMFAFLQALNFTIAGGLFMILFARIYSSVKKDDFVDYDGLYLKNRFLVFAMCIACLSLGGMAGFNIFVGEFLLYSFLFAIHPVLAIAAIMAGLVCFLFYFRICYTLMVRRSELLIPLPLPMKIMAAALTGLVVALGIMPQVLLHILEMVS